MQAQINAAPSFPEVEGQVYRFLRSHELLTNQWSWNDFEDGSEPECDMTSDQLQQWDRSRFHLRRGVAWVTHGTADLHTFVSKSSVINCKLPSKMFSKRDTRSTDAKRSIELLRPPMWVRGPLIDIRQSVCDMELLNVETPEADTPPAAAARRNGMTIDGLLRRVGLEPFQGRMHSGIDDTFNIARIMIELGERVRDCRTDLTYAPVRPSASTDLDRLTPDTDNGTAVPSPSESSEGNGWTTSPTSRKRRWNENGVLPADTKAPIRDNGLAPMRTEDEGGNGLIQASRRIRGGTKDQRKPVTRLQVEETILMPNVDTRRVGEKRWHWVGRKRGKVVWHYAPDPTI